MIETDRRYRVLVMLQRIDRPQYWTFHCPNCGREILPEVNGAMLAMTDTFESGDVSYGKGIRCDTGWCRYWFFFKLSS